MLPITMYGFNALTSLKGINTCTIHCTSILEYSYADLIILIDLCSF